MKQYWGKFVDKIDSMSLRERVLIFATVAFILVALAKTMLIDPLLARQKKLAAQVVQQQEKMKETQARIEDLIKAEKEDASSPLRQRLGQIEQQLAEGDGYLQSRHDRLVAPEKMADLLEQVLNKNGRLQLMNLQTLPAAPMAEKPVKPVKPVKAGATPAPVGQVAELDKQLFRHGVQITVRGSYMDLLQYLTELEQLPTKMFWGKAEMKVERHPDTVLTLTLYTLSLDKTWLQM